MLGCHTWHANALLSGVRTPMDDTDVATQTAVCTRAQDVERTGFALPQIRSWGRISPGRQYLKERVLSKTLSFTFSRGRPTVGGPRNRASGAGDGIDTGT